MTALQELFRAWGKHIRILASILFAFPVFTVSAGLSTPVGEISLFDSIACVT